MAKRKEYTPVIVKRTYNGRINLNEFIKALIVEEISRDK